MGYTHYWRQKGDFSQPAWDKIVQDTKKVLLVSKVPIQEDYNKKGPPIFNNSTIWFNGVGEDAHETFALQRIQEEIPDYQVDKSRGRFDFCKTAHKPYDLMVCATLLIAKHHAPETITLNSDGDWNYDWEEARDLVKEVLNIVFKESPIKE